MTIKSKLLKNASLAVMVFAVAVLLATVFVNKTSAAPVECDPSPCPAAPNCTNPRQCDAVTPVAPSPAGAPASGDDASAQLRSDAACVGDKDMCVPDQPDPGLVDCSNKDCNIVKKYLNPFINLLSIIVGIAVTIGIIIGGIQYSASGGDPQKAAAAKKHIRNALVGLIAFIFLYAFIRFLTPGNNLFNG